MALTIDEKPEFLAIYDICYAKTAEERDGYIAYIDELYNANRLDRILSEYCSIIGANILNIARSGL